MAPTTEFPADLDAAILLYDGGVQKAIETDHVAPRTGLVVTTTVGGAREVENLRLGCVRDAQQGESQDRSGAPENVAPATAGGSVSVLAIHFSSGNGRYSRGMGVIPLDDCRWPDGVTRDFGIFGPGGLSHGRSAS